MYRDFEKNFKEFKSIGKAVSNMGKIVQNEVVIQKGEINEWYVKSIEILSDLKNLIARTKATLKETLGEHNKKKKEDLEEE